MIPAPHLADGAGGVDPLDRALAWRARGFWTRSLQSTLIGSLAWLATGDLLAAAWLAVTIGLGVIDARLSALLLTGPRTRARIALAATGQALSAASFVAIALLLLRSPAPVHLAGAVLILCATCLNNAMMSRGSRLTTVVLVAPAAILLILSPFVARLFGYQIGLTDVLMLAVGSAAFTIFIVQMAASFSAKGQALTDALASLARHNAAAVEAEQEALASKQRWRMIFDHSPMARVCVDASRLYEILGATGPLAGAGLGDRLRIRFQSVSELFTYITMLDANGAAVGLCGDRLGVAHFTDASLDALCQALNDIDEDGVLPVFPAELIKADGDTLDVEVHVRLAPDGAAPWSLCLVTYVDVTEARRVARQHQEARDAAEVANRAKSDFLAVISHEIRTPLNGVLGMAQAMALNPLARAQRDRLKVITESGSALLAIVDDLLDLAKIEAGRLEIVNADFDLRALVESVHGAYAAEAASKGLGYSLNIESAIGGLYLGDAGRLRQIIGALIANALKFTTKGEVAVRVACGGAGVRCEVRDSGIGIPPDRIGKLFETFAQADSSMTRRFGGAGLGLAICQQLSRAMGGEITVSSIPGHGSVFVLELALPAAGAAARPDLPAAATGPVRILAAEDNPVNQQVLKALLGHIGLEPTIVENGVEAVQAWEDADWDLILMDVQMPLMDGETATRTIRAREAELGRTATPIIAVTANAMTHQVARYRAAGVNQVVAKPINVEELFSAMISAIALGEPQAVAAASPAKTSTSLRASSARR